MLAVTFLFGGSLAFWVGGLNGWTWIARTGGGVLGGLLAIMVVHGSLHPFALLVAGATALLAWRLKTGHHRIGSPLGWSGLIALLVAFGFKQIPGISPYPLEVDGRWIAFAPEKIILLLLLPALVPPPVAPDQRVGPRARPWQTWSWLLGLTLLALIPLATGLDQVRFGWPAPSWPLVAYALAYNLLFVCVVEESFFRGILQTALVRWTRRRAWPVADGWALGVTSLLFGLAHGGGGFAFAVLATVAGLGYGAAYYLTGRIGYAVSLHFAVNAVRELFFTGVPTAASVTPG